MRHARADRSARQALAVASRATLSVTDRALAEALRAVVRFGRALELLGAARAGASLSALALAAGYYDQAHMNADFRELAGITPRPYLEALRFPNGAHLAHAADGDDAGRFLQEAATAIA